MAVDWRGKLLETSNQSSKPAGLLFTTYGKSGTSDKDTIENLSIKDTLLRPLSEHFNLQKRGPDNLYIKLVNPKRVHYSEVTHCMQ